MINEERIKLIKKAKEDWGKPRRPTLMGYFVDAIEQSFINSDTILHGYGYAKKEAKKRKEKCEERNRITVLNYDFRMLAFIIRKLGKINNIDLNEEKYSILSKFFYGKESPEPYIEKALDLLNGILSNPYIKKYEDFEMDINEVRRDLKNCTENKYYKERFSIRCILKPHCFILDKRIPNTKRCKYCGKYK